MKWTKTVVEIAPSQEERRKDTKPVMGTRVSCSRFSTSRFRESIVFYGLFSGLHCVIIFVCSSLFFVVVVRFHPRMNVSYLMSVIFNVSICRQPEIIKLTGNFWCVNKFSLKTYRVTQFTSLRSQNWSVLTISLESPWNDCGSCEFTTILVKTRTRKTMKRRVNIIKRSRKEREICRQHEWDLLFNH